MVNYFISHKTKLDNIEDITPLTFTYTTNATNGIGLALNTTSGLVLDNVIYYRTIISDVCSNWMKYTIGEEIRLTTINDSIQFKNVSNNLSIDEDKYAYFVIIDGGRFTVSGNLQSMLNYKRSCTPFCFYKLFSGCTRIKSSAELEFGAEFLAESCYSNLFYQCSNMSETVQSIPYTVLKPNCYKSMFHNCSNLTAAPELPATTISASGYLGMFYGCGKLTETPELPATTLANNCYQQMFKNCNGLITAPELPATTLTDTCYTSMFESCKNLTTAPELPATTLANKCYQFMFKYCYNLTDIPTKLPAQQLESRCYWGMFYNCNSLTSIPELPATEIPYAGYYSMFTNCSSLTVVPELPAEKIGEYGCGFMFTGCSQLTKIPTLNFTEVAAYSCNKMFLNCTKAQGPVVIPCTNIAQGSYNEMFSGCKLIDNITVNFTEWIPSGETEVGTLDWVNGVSPTGTFICPSGLPHDANYIGPNYIPAGKWEIQTK